MNQEELNNRLLNIQIKLAYHFVDDILEPASYGVFRNDNYISVLMVMLKALWRYDVNGNCNSCLTEDQVCAILKHLEDNIPYPNLPKKELIDIGFTFNNHTFIINLKDCDGDCGCVSDYENIRITLFQQETEIAQYSLYDYTNDVLELKKVDECSVGFCLSGNLKPGLITMKLEVKKDGAYRTITTNYKLKILKNG